MQRGMQDGQSADGANTGGDLSDHDRELIVVVAQGFTNKEIGKRLYLGEATIGHRLGRLARKLNARNRAHLLTQAFKGRVIDFRDVE